MGNISGIRTVMSSGLGAGEAFVFSTAAIEVWEHRFGTLQITEPSVLGVQVAYAGAFTPLVIEDDAIIPLTPAFAATLLILREFMHHLGFGSVTLAGLRSGLAMATSR